MTSTPPLLPGTLKLSALEVISFKRRKCNWIIEYLETTCPCGFHN